MISSTMDKLRRMSARRSTSATDKTRPKSMMNNTIGTKTESTSGGNGSSIVEMIKSLKDLTPDQVKDLPSEAGIRLSLLQDLAKQFGHLTAAELCNEVLMPRTASAKCSFAAFLASNEETKHLVSDKAESFVSHAWKYSLTTLVDALAGGDPTDRFVWVDVFVVNQHARETLSQADWMEKFSSMLKTTGQAELVLYPFTDPIPVKRIWCVFEHACIVSNNVPYKVRMLPSDRQLFKEAVFAATGVGLDYFHDLFGRINVELAQAYLESDRTAILKIVREMGTYNVNAAAKNAVVSWLEAVLHEALNEADERSMQKNKAHTALGSFYQALGNYALSEDHFKKSVELSKELMEEGDLNVAVALNNLSIILQFRSKLQEALATIEESITIRSKLQGMESASMANSLSNRAEVLQAMGNLAGAAESHREALDIKRRVLGSSSPAVALSLVNLGGACRKLGKLDEAAEAYEEARTIYLKHPDTGETSLPMAGLYSNYSLVLSDKGKIDEAIAMQAKSLDTRKIVLGTRHLDVANSLHNLAGEYAKRKTQENLRNAMELYREASDIWKEHLGLDAPNVALSLMCQGNALCDLSQVYGGSNPTAEDLTKRRQYFDEAVGVQREALALRIRRLGESHIDTAFSQHNLAMLLKANKDPEAETLGKSALATFERVFGADIPTQKC